MSPASPSHRRNLLAYTALLVLVATGGAGLGRHLAHPALTPVLPAATDRLEGQTRARIDQAVDDVRRHPRSAADHGALGLVYEANELWHEALATYRQAAVLDPGRTAWRYRVAIALDSVGRTGEAIQLLTKLTDADPTLAPAWHRLGALRLGQGDIGGAQRAFEAAATHAPERSEGLVGVAQVALRRSQFDDAAATLERALAIDAGNRHAHYLLGRALAALGRDAEATVHLALGAATVARPLPDVNDERLPGFLANTPAQTERARWLLDRERPADAIPLLAAAVSARPDDTELRCVFARTCVRAGNLEQAETMTTALLLSDPDVACAHLALAELRLAQERWDDALAAANQAVTIAPRTAAPRVARGRALHALGQRPLAGTTLLTARVIDPVDPEIALILGRTLLELGETEVGLEHLSAIAELGPGRVGLLTQAAEALLDAGVTDGIARLLDVAALTAPDDRRIRTLRQRTGAHE